MNMEKKIKFNSVINGKKFKIVRPKKDTHVMAIPLDNFPTSGLHIIYNELHIFRNHYDLFNEAGIKEEKEEPMYLVGYDSTPSFYLRSGQNTIKVDCSDENYIKFLPITPTDKIETMFDITGYNISSSATCWGIFVFDVNKIDGEKLAGELTTWEKMQKKRKNNEPLQM